MPFRYGWQLEINKINNYNNQQSFSKYPVADFEYDWSKIWVRYSFSFF